MEMRLNKQATFITAAMFATPAMAQDFNLVGKPEAGKIGFQEPATEIASRTQNLDAFLLVVITIVTLFVISLIAYSLIVYNRKSNDTPATFTHNTKIEVAWTLLPILVLLAILAPSLKVLFFQQEIPEADITIKTTGYQWYWGYEYVGTDLAYDSYMIGSGATGGDFRMSPEVEAQLVEHGYSKDEFLLATDTAVVVPSGKNVVLQVTGGDVIHSWTIPAFGVKQDAVPGRLAELWFNVDEGKEGTYFGQCSELCGIQHAYMPITVHVVTSDTYDAWLAASVDAGEYVDLRTVLTN